MKRRFPDMKKSFRLGTHIRTKKEESELRLRVFFLSNDHIFLAIILSVFPFIIPITVPTNRHSFRAKIIHSWEYLPTYFIFVCNLSLLRSDTE